MDYSDLKDIAVFAGFCLLAAVIIFGIMSFLVSVSEQPYREFCLKKGFDKHNQDYPYLECIKFKGNNEIEMGRFYCNPEKVCSSITYVQD